MHVRKWDWEEGIGKGEMERWHVKSRVEEEQAVFYKCGCRYFLKNIFFYYKYIKIIFFIFFKFNINI
jgi:hypothetical protein